LKASHRRGDTETGLVDLFHLAQVDGTDSRGVHLGHRHPPRTAYYSGKRLSLLLFLMPFEGDDRILDISRELCQQLNITNYNPTSLTWRYEVQRGRTRAGTPIMGILPWDQCVLAKNTIILPVNMKEALEPDMWRPIIASSLFYKKTLRTRIIIGITLRTLLFVAITLVLFFALQILLPQPYTAVQSNGVAHTGPLGAFVAILLAPIILFVGPSYLSYTYLKRIRLLADQDAADIVGAPLFISVLTQIERLDTNGSGKTGNRRGAGGGYSLPTLQQRLQNLQTYSGTATK
jgi:hypothetical protein